MQPVEAALETASIVMRNGGSTVAAARTFTNILTGYKVKGVSGVWRLDFIAATGAIEGQSFTDMRPVGPIGVNLVRASEMEILGERVAYGEVIPGALDAEITRIKQVPTPYNPWLALVAAACVAAALSQFAGGDWGSLGIALVAAGVGQALRSQLQVRKVPAANVTLICGLLSACIASVGLRLGFSQVAPVTLIASVIYLAPGLPLINGFVDVLSHKHLLVGIERIANALYLFLVLAIAIALADTVIL
jgi:uncharacterized membrane protein YjjP (DUF1212 family)